MRAQIYGLLLASTVFAAVGQVLFKIGATGRPEFAAYVNAWLISGLACYIASTLLWIRALAEAPLTVVYPFTALTFVLVYLLGVAVLHESMTARAWLGVGCVLAGLALISSS